MREPIASDRWRERLDAIAGRRRDAWIVAGVVGVVVLAGFALWGRTAPARIAPPATSLPPTSGPPAPSVLPGAAGPTPSGTILVHVAGAVRRPGLFELTAGTRIADAIDAAGGAGGRADLDALNLAESLSDGQKVEVPRRGEASLAAPLPSLSPGVVNINQADQPALESIPGIGPVTATAILEYRSQIGSFSSVDQLLEVSGIGPATLESMRPYVTI